MLTQEDLKNIGDLIDIKLVFLENRIDAKMDARFAIVDARFDAMDARMDSLDARMDSLEENVNSLSESMEEIRSTVNVLAAWADKTSKIVQIAL